MSNITSKHINDARILSYVVRYPGCTAKDLHNGTDYTHLTATSKAIKLLSEAGFMEVRRDDKDARRVQLHVTGLGLNYLAMLRDEILDHAQKLLDVVKECNRVCESENFLRGMVRND